jgi:hypothetical protein
MKAKWLYECECLEEGEGRERMRLILGLCLEDRMN